MNQTRAGSLIEAVFNTAIGLAVSLAANALVFPAFGFHPSLGENVAISCIYTAISLIRQYVIRRWFNARLHRAAQALAEAVSAPPSMHADSEPCPSCLDTVRGLQRTREVVATCSRCGMRWLHGRYVAKPTNDQTRTK